uniref:Uncharacterized protein n=1 Tax=Ditylenchus dipsaci TaxID=166011 RepID=A0A915E465_9BILA
MYVYIKENPKLVGIGHKHDSDDSLSYTNKWCVHLEDIATFLGIVNNESTNEWWLQSSSSSPATSDPPTTSQPLSRSSLVMMQQEEYPKEELSYSKKQLYPWERQRELLVPFSSTKSAQSDSLHKQVTFANKNYSGLDYSKKKQPNAKASRLNNNRKFQ